MRHRVRVSTHVASLHLIGLHAWIFYFSLDLTSHFVHADRLRKITLFFEIKAECLLTSVLELREEPVWR